MSSEYVVELRNCTKIFPGVVALDEMQLAVRPGEILGLIGENGAGKSTLIKVLTGVHKPDKGEIYVNGQKLAFKNPNESAAAGIACVYQELNMEKQLSITDNIFINKWIKGPGGLLDYKTMHKKAKEVIVVIVIYVIMHILLTRTALGRSIYCAGGNPEATRLSGINSANVLTFCYTISGLMAGIAGIVSLGRSGTANGATAIQPYDTDAIASCVIGGASFMGGKGTMLGTMIGALVIATLRNGFTLLAISSAVQNMVLGLVIIAAVLLDVYREAMAAFARRREAAAKARA